MIKITIIPNKSKIDAMTVYPFLFVRKGYKIDQDTFVHENIHALQQRDYLYVGLVLMGLFSLILCFSPVWLIFLLLFPFCYYLDVLLKGYRNTRFEREAYENEGDIMYLIKRKFMNDLKY